MTLWEPLRTDPERIRRSFVPIDAGAYGHEDFYSQTIFSDTAWCGLCGQQMRGIYGGTVKKSVDEHRLHCRKDNP